MDIVEDFATKAGDALAGIAREIADKAYNEMLANLETYLVENAVFNIGSKIDAADRSALLARQEAEALRARLAELEGENARYRHALEAIATTPPVFPDTTRAGALARQALGGSDGRA
jgi:BMFP domain-containing protein YqiC